LLVPVPFPIIQESVNEESIRKQPKRQQTKATLIVYHVLHR